MSVIITGTDKPCTCCECPFRSKYEKISIDVGVYKKVSFCTFAPDDVEDPYRDIAWQTKNIEEWCPIQEVATDNVSADYGKSERYY